MLQGLGGLLPREAWHGLLAAGTPRAFRRDDLLLRQGDYGSHVLVLTHGRVKVTRVEQDGSMLLLAVRGPGQVLGEISALDGSPRSATVVALDTCLTYIVSTARFRSTIERFGLQQVLLKHMARLLRESEVIRAELAELPATGRVLRTLARLGAAAAADHGYVGVDLALSQEEFAGAVGLSRSAVAAELARLRERGLLTTGRRRLRIHDLRTLRDLADAEQRRAGPSRD